MRSARWHGLVVVIAVLLGVGTGLLLGTRFTQANAAEGPRERFARPIVPATSTSGPEHEQIALLEARLRRLEARPEPSAAPSGAAPAAESVAADPLAPEQAPEERFLKQVEERRALHASEPTDSVWAGRVAPSLRSDLLALATSDAGNSFRVEGVECRTTSCAARLIFPNYRVATDSASLLLHALYSQHCGTTVFVPEPASHAAPYELTMYFECEGTRF